MEEGMLRRFSERLRDDPRYLSWVIRRYSECEGLSRRDIMHELGVTEDMLLRLETCMTPPAAAADFSERVRAISDFALADETALTQIIRRVHVLEALSSARPDTALPAAARDRDVEGSEQDLDTARGEDSSGE